LSHQRRRENHIVAIKSPKSPRTLLKALLDVEDEIKALKRDSLKARLKDLREQVKVVLERHEDEIKRIHAEINDPGNKLKY
jgi:hypothetical protein